MVGSFICEMSHECQRRLKRELEPDRTSARRVTQTCPQVRVRSRLRG
jgi:hypothetical protein